MSLSAVKPPRWAVNHALLAPEARDLARGLIVALPFFGVSGDRVYDVARHESSTIPPGWTWEVSEQGYGPYKTDAELAIPLTGTEGLYTPPFTVLAVVDRVSSPGTSAALVDNRVDTTGVGWSLRAEQWNSTGQVGFTVYGIADYVSSFPTPTGKAVVGAAVDSASTLRIFLDGVIETYGTIAAIAPTTEKLHVGATAANGSSAQAMFLAVYMWERSLTDVEIQKVSADPFMLLRRNPVPAVIAAVSSGAVFTESLAALVDITAVGTDTAVFVESVVSDILFGSAASAVQTMLESGAVDLSLSASVSDVQAMVDSVAAGIDLAAVGYDGLIPAGWAPAAGGQAFVRGVGRRRRPHPRT